MPAEKSQQEQTRAVQWCAECGDPIKRSPPIIREFPPCLGGGEHLFCHSQCAAEYGQARRATYLRKWREERRKRMRSVRPRLHKMRDGGEQ
jgi:hypothetical protein